MFVDIHTHHLAEKKDIISIYNVNFNEFEKVEKENPHAFFSVGIHPWDLEKGSFDWQKLERYASFSQVKLIGECGMDKNITTPIEKQLSIFEKHIYISEKLQKPLIIHCVGCFNQLMALYRKRKPTQRWIIHGFRGKPQLATSLLKVGISLSFGQRFNPLSVKVTPLEHLFVESDDKEMDIHELYNQIATLKNCHIKDINAGEIVIF